MKRFLCFAVAGIMLLSLPGCALGKQMENPVDFYYLQQSPEDEVPHGVMEAEQREAGSQGENLEYLLKAYLSGPLSRSLTNPFPSGLKLVEVRQRESGVEVTVSDSLAELTPLSLNLACACLAKTVFGLTGTQKVTITTENTLLLGAQSVVITQEALILTDDPQTGGE